MRIKRKLFAIIIGFVVALSMTVVAYASCGIPGCTCVNGYFDVEIVGGTAEGCITLATCSETGKTYYSTSSHQTSDFISCDWCGYIYPTSGGGSSNGSSSGSSSSGGSSTDNTCYHGSSYSVRSGCTLYYYCSSCGEYMSSITSHQSESYTYINTSYHRGYCSSCGTYTTSDQSHYITPLYASNNATQHYKYSYCPTCNTYVTSTTENHTDNNSDGLCDFCSYKMTVPVYWYASTNGGTINGSNYHTTNVNYGSTATAPSGTPVKTGYTFKGWYTAASGGSLYSTVACTSTTYFYAQFIANSYTITWNSAGGSAVSSTTQVFDQKLNVPVSPTRDGYTFRGWYTAATGGNQVTDTTIYKTASDITYYAQWENKNVAPVIVSTTPADAAVVYPSEVTLSVSASGMVDGTAKADLTYQWQEYKSGSWTNISGATDSQYTISGGTTAGSYQYRAIVTAAFDGDNKSSTSRTAAVIIEKADGILDIAPIVTPEGTLPECIVDPSNNTQITDNTDIIFALGDPSIELAGITANPGTTVTVTSSDSTKVQADIIDGKLVLSPVGTTNDQPVKITIQTAESDNYEKTSITFDAYVGNGPYVVVEYTPSGPAHTNQDVIAAVKVTDVFTYIDPVHMIDSVVTNGIAVSEVSAPAVIWGDINGDGSVTSEDSVMLQKYLQGTETLSVEQQTAADVDGNGTINDWDATLITQKTSDNARSFPTEHTKYYEIVISENSTHTITASDSKNSETTKTIEVNWIDKIPPELDVINYEVDTNTGKISVFIQAIDEDPSDPDDIGTPTAELLFCWNYTEGSASNIWVHQNLNSFDPGTTLTVAVKDKAGNISIKENHEVRWTGRQDGNNTQRSVLTNVYSDFSGYIFGKEAYLDAQGSKKDYSASGYEFRFKVNPSNGQYVGGYLTINNQKFAISWFQDEGLTMPTGELSEDNTLKLVNGSAYGVVNLDPAAFATRSLRNAEAVLLLTQYSGLDISGKMGAEKYEMSYSVDITGPVITINYNTYTKELKLSAIDTLSGVNDNEISYSIGSATDTCPSSSKFTYPEDGSVTAFTVTVTAEDRLGNISIKSSSTLRPFVPSGDGTGGEGNDGSGSTPDGSSGGKTTAYGYKSKFFTHYLVNGTRSNIDASQVP